MFGIIAAMEKEIERLKQIIKVDKTIEIAKRTFIVGRINDKDVVIVKAGIGKVNAALTTSLLIDHFNVDKVINLGIAGGVCNVNTYDLVIADKLSYHDVDATKIDDVKIGQLPEEKALFVCDLKLVKKASEIADKSNLSYKVGMIVTGDQFVTDIETLEKINAEYDNILACDMEACAIAQVCNIYNVSFVVLRVISDVLSDKNQVSSYLEASNKACLIASIFLTDFVN